MAMPLEGIKVVDLTRLAPDPFCTMVLGDLGGDVVRVEQTGGGRYAQAERRRQEPDDATRERRRAAFNALNRNKRSIALDLKRAEARQVLHRLCSEADVFVEGFRPGVVKRNTGSQPERCWAKMAGTLLKRGTNAMEPVKVQVFSDYI